MLIDESESIRPVVGSYINGINNVITTQRTLSPNSRFSLIMFNTEVKVKYFNVLITDVPIMLNGDLVPSGLTAMYNAIATVFNEKKDDRPTIMIVMTDGLDNCSGVRPDQLIPYIAQLKQQNWTFLFLGASKQSNLFGRLLGMDCILYDNTPASIERASEAINIAISKVHSSLIGRPVHLSEKDLPDDVSDLANILNGIKI